MITVEIDFSMVVVVGTLVGIIVVVAPQAVGVVAQGCIKGLCDLLSCPDPEVVSICLEGLENILWVGEADKEVGLHDSVNIYAQRVEECEGLDKIQKLLVHDNDEIFEMALRILKKFWPVLENDLEAILDLHIEPDGEEYILDIQIAR